MKRTVLFVALLGCNALIGGDLTTRYELTLDRVLNGSQPKYTEDFILADAIPRHDRQFTEYSGELSGRYIEALAVISGESRKQFPSLDRIVAALPKYQKPDGHFGDTWGKWEIRTEDMQMLLGQGRLLTGLVEYYKLHKSPEVLVMATRLGDFLVAVAPLINNNRVGRDFREGSKRYGYNAWTQNIEGLVELYRLTSFARFRNTAAQMAQRFDLFPAQHGEGIVATMLGMLELYKAADDKTLLDAVEKNWRTIANPREMLIQGAIPEETYFDARREEGCATSGWLRLNLALWSLTHKPEYLEAAEIAIFNAFAFDQFQSGDFGNHELTGSGVSYRHMRAWWCCTLSGLRAFHDIFGTAFRAEADALFYDLPIDGYGEAGGFAMRAESSLGENATILISVLKSSGSPRTLVIRQPRWATSIGLEANGKRFETESRDGYLRVRREWKPGETLKLAYHMKTRAVQKQGMPNQVAIFHGPWLLAVDEAASPHFFDEAMPYNRIFLPPVSPDGAVRLEPAPQAASTGAQFAVPVAHFTVKFMPGQTAMQTGTAELRPIAEHTAGEDFTPVEFWLRPSREGEKFVRQNDNF